MKLVQVWKNNSHALGIQVEKGVIDVTAERARRGLAAPGPWPKPSLWVNLVWTCLRSCLTGRSASPMPPGPGGHRHGPHLLHQPELPPARQGVRPAPPPAPVLFNKFSNALAAHGDRVRLMPDYKEYDYEAELVVVMGRNARDVSVDEALDYVYGYTCGNDLSCRDLQFTRGGQWVLSKTFDGFAPVGPCLVPAGELDPANLDISSVVNGETRQSSNTSDMIFSAAQIIADLSHHFTLQPGDLIFTGTPQGVMHGYPADQKNWRKPGERVSVTIQGIGTLSTSFC